MTKGVYANMLTDEKWRKKRMSILERDNYTCQDCGWSLQEERASAMEHERCDGWSADSEEHKRWCSTARLHVHHKSYKGKPWEVADSELVTLCEWCHEKREILKRNEKWEKEVPAEFLEWFEKAIRQRRAI